MTQPIILNTFTELNINVQRGTFLSGQFFINSKELILEGYPNDPIPLDQEIGVYFIGNQLKIKKGNFFSANPTLFETKVKHVENLVDHVHFYYHKYINDLSLSDAFTIIIGEGDMRKQRILSGMNVSFACSLQYVNGEFVLKLEYV